MDDEEVFTPKDLEVLPHKIVHDIVQYGITYDSSCYDGQTEDSSEADSKALKKYSPKNRKFKKEALCSINRVASLFVLYITTVAESISRANKRSTVFDKDILQALRQCMFWEVESQLSEESQNLESQPSGTKVSEDAKLEENEDLDAMAEDEDLGLEEETPKVEEEEAEMDEDDENEVEKDPDEEPFDDENLENT